MIRALSTAATGMNALQTKLDVNANNIANSQTAGFKRGRAEFQDLMYQTTRAPGANTGAGSRAPTGLQVGLGVRVVGTSTQQSQGDLRQTENPLDIAVEGRGYFVVQTPDGELAYTRDGAFKLDVDGPVVKNDGYPLAAAIVVPADAQTVTVGADGIVTATLAGEVDPIELGQLELATFANPGGLMAKGRSLFSETAASGTAILGPPGTAGVGSVTQGMLELSNVKVVEEMIDLISGQRAYEVNSRVIKAADEMMQQTSNLG